jgi:phosphopantothenoylcysteine decarboxylase/phosphopantothenate--cysteine ligase
LLGQQGAEVRVVMTASAQQFITALTFQALTGNSVHTELLDAEQEKTMGHIHLARWADVLLVAPATANMLAKFSYGLADDLLSTLFLAAECPVYIAPAMNQAMWKKPVTQENVQRLEAQGSIILGPAEGNQACGEIGPGRMLEPEQICQYIFNMPISGPLQGKSLLISAGPTREPIDPVRYISNRSSGKMGYALARAAVALGGKVTLVSGPVMLARPAGINFISVETATQMYGAVMGLAGRHDIYIGAAAVADYTPLDTRQEKIKKNAAETVLKLARTRDILSDVAVMENRPFTVGFAAETHNLKVYAIDKLKRKKLDMIAANQVGQEQGGFDSDQNALQVFWQQGQQDLIMTDKNLIAVQLLELIARKYNEKCTT